MTSKEEMLIKSENDKKVGFNEWMKNPMAKALISTIPPSENLEVLLKACFESGYGCGVGSVMFDIISAMTKSKSI